MANGSTFVKNRLKQMLKDGKIPIGAVISVGNSEVAEIMGHIGFDWIWFDLEHSPVSIETTEVLLQATSAYKCVPIVRVPWNDPVVIKRVLDIGAFGIIVPMVNSREEAERAVAAIRYPPDGIRGVGPGRVALDDPDYIATANKEIFLAVQIETQKAIDSIDDILSVQGIDVALVGPFDLSMNLGVLSQWENPKFVSALKRIVDSAQRHNVAPGIAWMGDVTRFLQLGFRFVSIGVDSVFMEDAARSALQTARNAVNL